MPSFSPTDWVDVLVKRLDARQSQIARWNAYYEGSQPLIFATEKFRKAFGGLFDEFSDNWCAPVVNAVDERLSIVGFRFGEDTAADQAAWRIWQANHFDAESKLGIKASLIDARAYAMAWPDPTEPTIPMLSIESAEQVLVAYGAGSRRSRVAAVKKFIDEWTGKELVTLYLPDRLFKFERYTTPDGQVVAKADDPTWIPRVGEDFEQVNPLGVVPIVEIPNDPRMTREPRSELESVIPLQDAVNKLLADMIVASEFGAFKQKWATGVDIPVDPETNQPIDTFRTAMERFITAPPSELGEEPAKFGEFSETPLANFVAAIDMLVSHLASQSRTPPHYLSTSADRLSGESIKSAETGLVAKARDKQLHMGEGFEELMRLAFRCIDDPRADDAMAEVVWKDPETRSESEHIDAVGKKRQMLSVPLVKTWEEAGYSPQEISRFQSMLAEEQLFADLLVSEPAATEPQPAPPSA